MLASSPKILKNLDFDYMLAKLPVELITRIFEIHMATFPPYILAGSTPPICLASSTLRRITIPMFYQQCSFELKITAHEFPNGVLRWSTPTEFFLATTDVVNLRLVRRIRLTVIRRILDLPRRLDSEHTHSATAYSRAWTPDP